jgi:hypothetical protein
MELPHSKQRQKYIDEIREIESSLKEATSGSISVDRLRLLQSQLDKMATQYQYKDEIGPARYKLYEIQAFIYYFERKDEGALDFITQAIEMRGTSYPKAERLKVQIVSGASKPNSNGILFFHKSPTTVFWLSFLTLNLYNIYWFYKQWRTIRVSTGVRTWPILSSIFQVFTAYSLFKRIRDNAEKNKYKKLRGVGWLTVSYIIVILLSNGLSRIEIRGAVAGTITQVGDIAALTFTIVFGVLLALIIAKVQEAANAHNIAVLGKDYKFRKIYAGEIIFSIIGIGLFVLGMYQYSHDIIANQYPRATQAEIRVEGAKADSLRAEYDLCSNSLDYRYDKVDTSSDYAVNSYNNDLRDCEDTRIKLNSAVERYNWLAGY